MKDGWEPLCKFLEKELPEVPFPHLNLRTEFALAAEEEIERQRERFRLLAIAIGTFATAGLAMIWAYL